MFLDDLTNEILIVIRDNAAVIRPAKDDIAAFLDEFADLHQQFYRIFQVM